MTEECPFCAIAAGSDDDAHVVHRSSNSVAFLDRNPAATGHTLVVPRQHVTGIEDLDPTTHRDLFRTVHRLSNALDSAFGADGLSMFYTTGPVVGTVDHAHVHLIPRVEDDPISVTLTRSPLSSEAGYHQVERIQEALP